MAGIPGRDIVMLAAANIYVGGDKQGLLSEMDRLMIDSWAAYCPGSNGPIAFIASSSVIPHIMSDMPATLGITGAWAKWIDDWMKKNLQTNRYIDATEYAIASSAEKKPVEQPKTVVETVISAIKESMAPQEPEPPAQNSVAKIEEPRRKKFKLW